MNRDEQRSRKSRPIRWIWLTAVVMATGPGIAMAAEEQLQEVPIAITAVSQDEMASSPIQEIDDIVGKMVQEGKVHLNIRGRVEVADQDGLDSSTAWTERTRLGFTTGEYNGLSIHGDFEDIRAANYSAYNAAGLNDQPGKTVIADPEDTELNQLYANLNLADYNSTIRAGRQRVLLDDQRFVGNVGWRQNEQTFDAAVLMHQCTENITGVYGYVWHINRIYGPDANMDLDTSTHLINVAYEDEDFGKLTGFAYLLDVEDADTLSSNTYGVRYEATRAIKGDPDGPKIKYTLSYANQSEAADNPTDYNADYFLANIKYIDNGWYVGGGYELLGSDDGMASFQTPLATGHKFNGWADVFLTTPADGLEDIYVYLGGDLPAGFKGKVVYHWFDSDEGSDDFGNELDIKVSKKLTDHADLVLKYAMYDGDGSFADRDKFWAQVTLDY